MNQSKLCRVQISCKFLKCLKIENETPHTPSIFPASVFPVAPFPSTSPLPKTSTSNSLHFEKTRPPVN